MTAIRVQTESKMITVTIGGFFKNPPIVTVLHITALTASKSFYILYSTVILYSTGYLSLYSIVVYLYIV